MIPRSPVAVAVVHTMNYYLRRYRIDRMEAPLIERRSSACLLAFGSSETLAVPLDPSSQQTDIVTDGDVCLSMVASLPQGIPWLRP